MAIVTDIPVHLPPALDNGGAVFNARHRRFGCHPDADAATNAGGIQLAIAEATAAGGGDVLIPSGTYLIDSPIILATGVNLRGSGWRYASPAMGTRLQCVGDIDALTTGLTATDDVNFVTAVSVSDISLRADNDATAGSGLLGYGLRYQVVFERVAFSNFPDNNIALSHSWESKFDHVYCRGKTGGTTTNVLLHNGNNQVYFFGGMYNSGQFGFLATADAVSNQIITIEGALMEGNSGAAVYARSAHTLTVKRCYIEANAGRGIRVGNMDSTHKVFTLRSEGNRFHNNASSDIVQDAGSSDAQIVSEEDYFYNSTSAVARLQAADNADGCSFHVYNPRWETSGPAVRFGRRNRMQIIGDGEITFPARPRGTTKNPGTERATKGSVVYNENAAHATEGALELYDGNRYRHIEAYYYTSERPTSGTWAAGDYVKNSAPTVMGSASSQYVIKGWIRLTTGSDHVLNTDWVQDRALTGT